MRIIIIIKNEWLLDRERERELRPHIGFSVVSIMSISACAWPMNRHIFACILAYRVCVCWCVSHEIEVLAIPLPIYIFNSSSHSLSLSLHFSSVRSQSMITHYIAMKKRRKTNERDKLFTHFSFILWCLCLSYSSSHPVFPSLSHFHPYFKRFQTEETCLKY